MDRLPFAAHPETLVPGETYWFVERPLTAAPQPDGCPVRFVAYDPCPAMVIVENGAGQVRIQRCDLRLV